jgi:3-oxoacyl-[acyl-carrier protein] reductase
LQGAAVLLNDIDESLTNSAVRKIKDEGGNCIGIAGDASDIDFINEMVKQAVNNFGKLTIAIANAGITLFADFFDLHSGAFSKVMQLNLGGSFFLAQAAAKQMKQQQTGGSILFMSSVVGHQAHKNLAAYAITKAGLEMSLKTS